MRPGPAQFLWILLAGGACAPQSAMAPSSPQTTVDEPSDEADDDEGSGDDRTLPPSPGPVGAGLLAEARRELAAMRSSRYVHRTDVDEEAGRFDYDCSGFVSYALARAQPDAYQVLRVFAQRRPLAKHYVSWIQSLEEHPSVAWRRVAEVGSLVPGDVIAWRRPADSASRSTGHVLIVAGAVERREAGEWVVPIVDSTAIVHGRADSRRPARATGLGLGTIVLVADARGAPVAFRWSPNSASRVRKTQIALARVDGPGHL
jgi:hypothetical protein